MTPEGDVPYVVVVNDEEQYSIWPAQRALPAGWTAVTAPEDRASSLDSIAQRWTDMRPRSTRIQDAP